MTFVEEVAIGNHINDLLLITKRTYTTAMGEISVQDLQLISTTLKELQREIELHQACFIKDEF